jgi:hypothetical protein
MPLENRIKNVNTWPNSAEIARNPLELSTKTKHIVSLMLGAKIANKPVLGMLTQNQAIFKMSKIIDKPLIIKTKQTFFLGFE